MAKKTTSSCLFPYTFENPLPKNAIERNQIN